MNLLSIDTKAFDVRAYAITGGNRVKLKHAQFNQVLLPEEIEAMRSNPEKFIADLTPTPEPEVVKPRPPLSLVDTTPCETEPSVA